METEEGQLAYGWDYAPAIAPTVPSADVNYGAYSSDQEITWSQNNWFDGGLNFYYQPDFPNAYALADKVWTSTRNEVSLAPDATPIAFGVQNGRQSWGKTPTVNGQHRA